MLPSQGGTSRYLSRSRLSGCSPASQGPHPQWFWNGTATVSDSEMRIYWPQGPRPARLMRDDVRKHVCSQVPLRGRPFATGWNAPLQKPRLYTLHGTKGNEPGFIPPKDGSPSNRNLAISQKTGVNCAVPMLERSKSSGQRASCEVAIGFRHTATWI